MRITLPWPPSVNHYWRHVGPRILVSRAGIRFRRDVAAVLLSLGLPRVEGRLCISVLAHPPDRRSRDLDNILKALLDALQHGGLYADDSQIDDLRIVRSEPMGGGCVVVKVEKK